jgi:hypothetical protein
MRRIKIMGLCLVAVFAFSAMGVSAAQAGEYGVCKIIPETKPKADLGQYATGKCENKGVGAERDWEWWPGITAHTGPAAGGYGSNVSLGYFNFTSTTGAAVLKSAAGNITCAKSTDIGKITGSKSDIDQVKFEECVLSATAGKCTTTGQTTGVIRTETLVTTLIDHGEKGLSGLEPALGEVWLQFSAKPPGTFLANFVCEPGVIFRVKGSVSGIQTGDINVMSLTSTDTFGEGKGEQDLITEFSQDGGQTYTAVPSVQEAVGTNKGKKIEVKT